MHGSHCALVQVHQFLHFHNNWHYAYPHISCLSIILYQYWCGPVGAHILSFFSSLKAQFMETTLCGSSSAGSAGSVTTPNAFAVRASFRADPPATASATLRSWPRFSR